MKVPAAVRSSDVARFIHPPAFGVITVTAEWTGRALKLNEDARLTLAIRECAGLPIRVARVAAGAGRDLLTQPMCQAARVAAGPRARTAGAPARFHRPC